MMEIVQEELSYQFRKLRFQLVASRKHQAQRVLVNGSPKTGTTWMLHMIACIPGYRIVGNFDRRIERYADVQPGDVVHGHDWYQNGLPELISDNEIRVVLMIRDPRDQLVSRMFHIRRSPRHAWHERFKSMSDDEGLFLCIEGSEGLPGTKAMVNLTRTWLDGNAPIISVRYEQLLADPYMHFRRVMDYLGSNDDRLASAIVTRNRFERHSVGWQIWRRPRKPGQEDASAHLRKGIAGDWRNYLKPAHCRRLKQLIGTDLIALNYERDMEW